MIVKIEEIGRITTGVYEKGRPSGDTYYLQAKHFDELGKFRADASIIPEIQMEPRLHKHLLQDNDILIMAKGGKNRACLYQSEIGQAVASSTFFVLRLHVSSIVPGFLKWYLNTSRMQSALSNLSKGTHILSLSKKSLSKVRIEIPSQEKQQEILRIHQLWENEKTKTLELIKLKESFYENILLNESDKN